MSEQIFIIQNDNGIHSLYADLEKAKNELKTIYNNTPDYKKYGYQITVYTLVDREYIASNTIYTIPGLFRGRPVSNFEGDKVTGEV